MVKGLELRVCDAEEVVHGVVEIAADLTTALPKLDRATYADFVRANRPLLRLLRSRANSYWNCYYRRDYWDKSRYPPLVFLREIASWAA